MTALLPGGECGMMAAGNGRKFAISGGTSGGIFMDDATWGLIGGIAGGVLGTLGGLFGTWMSIRNTKTRAERRFMIRAAIGMWAVLAIFLTVSFLAGQGIFPPFVRWIAMAVFFGALGPAIVWVNRQQARLRGEEPGPDLLAKLADEPPPPPAPPPSPPVEK